MIISIALLAALGLILYYWHHIVYFFQNKVIPVIREKMGDRFADAIAWFLSILDGVAVATRKGLKACWRWIRENVLGYRETYIQKNASQWIEKTSYETVDGTLVTERTVSADAVPDSVRNEALKYNQTSFVIDQKAILEERAREVARKTGLEEILTNEV